LAQRNPSLFLVASAGYALLTPLHAEWETRQGTPADLLLAFWALIGLSRVTSCPQPLTRNALRGFAAFFNRVTHPASRSIKESIMAKMTKNQLIDAIAEGTQVSKGDVKAVIEHMATVGYKELNESGEFVIPGFAKMSVVNKPATEARSGINPFTKEPMEFAAKPASKSVKASPLKVAKDAV
jgi:DNA-binding protein HU-beta